MSRTRRVRLQILIKSPGSQRPCDVSRLSVLSLAAQPQVTQVAATCAAGQPIPAGIRIDTFYDVAHRPDAAEVSACASFRLFSRGAEGEGRSRARQCVSVMVLTNGIADDLEDSTDGCTPADGSQRRAWSLHRSWHHDNPMNNDV